MRYHLGFQLPVNRLTFDRQIYLIDIVDSSSKYMETTVSVFKEIEFVVLVADNRTWFRATDVCKFLGYSNPFESVRLHCKDYQYREWQVGKGRPSVYVLESGLYRLILRSKKPDALAFQDWVTDEVLPSIRRDGVYISPEIATHQAVAAKEKLNRILDAAAPWERLYDENRNKGFKWFGYRFYNDYVYCFLTTEEWCKINQLNPVRKEVNGRCDRLERIHQYIEPETKSRLRDTVATILGFVDVSNTPEEFQELYRRKYGRVEQLRLELGGNEQK